MTDYATADEVKAVAPDTFADSVKYDDLIGDLIARASRLIDGLFGHKDDAFKSASATRVFNGRGGSIAKIDPCTSITTVSVKTSETSATYTDWVPTDWNAGAGSHRNPDWNAGYLTFLQVAPGNSKSFTVGQKTIQIVALWGRTAAVPDVVKMATIIMVTRWFGRGQQMFTDTSAFPELGQMTFTQALDPDIKTILRNSRLMRNPMG